MADKTNNVDWSVLRTRLKRLRSHVDPFRVVTREQAVKDAQVAAAIEATEEPNIEDMAFGYSFYASNDEHAFLLRRVAWEFGFGESYEFDFPIHLRKSRRPLIEIAEICIANETMTTEFINAWAELHSIWGAYFYLLGDDDRAKSEFLAATRGAKNQVRLLQQLWYAKWMKVRARSLYARDREGENLILAKICLRISDGNADPVLWNRDKYVEMLATEDSKTVQTLKSTYIDLSARELQSLLADAEVLGLDLPPTEPEAFESR